MSAEVEKWRVSTIEGVFEADLDTLKLAEEKVEYLKKQK